LLRLESLNSEYDFLLDEEEIDESIDEMDDSDETSSEALLGVRHLQTLMLFLAMVLAFGMRVNMSIAIVDMTDPDNENVSTFFFVFSK
jgi:hypothetical protein